MEWRQRAQLDKLSRCPQARRLDHSYCAGRGNNLWCCFPFPRLENFVIFANIPATRFCECHRLDAAYPRFYEAQFAVCFLAFLLLTNFGRIPFEGNGNCSWLRTPQLSAGMRRTFHRSIVRQSSKKPWNFESYTLENGLKIRSNAHEIMWTSVVKPTLVVLLLLLKIIVKPSPKWSVRLVKLDVFRRRWSPASTGHASSVCYMTVLRIFLPISIHPNCTSTCRVSAVQASAKFLDVHRVEAKTRNWAEQSVQGTLDLTAWRWTSDQSEGRKMLKRKQKALQWGNIENTLISLSGRC